MMTCGGFDVLMLRYDPFAAGGKMRWKNDENDCCPLARVFEGFSCCCLSLLNDKPRPQPKGKRQTSPTTEG